ncbi:MAG: TIGR03986 family CRISPR-associated RAMP protein [bacterium]|nr:TIGR03986 family CRISPR-associated RAMP protein [bacterium]
MPRHINPNINPTDMKKMATAPYNFVPLPNCIYTVANGIEANGREIRPWKMHDQFVPGTHSGWIDLSIKTLTPLFIRGPVIRSDDKWDKRDSRLRPEPFTTPDGRPLIPGSSLRGMIRTLVEILSFSKIVPVTEERPFFRDMSPGRLADSYREHFIDELGNLASGVDISSGDSVNIKAAGYRARVRAGIVKREGAKWAIQECGLTRVEQSLIKETLNINSLLYGSGPMATPSQELQHRHVYVKGDEEEQNYFFEKKIRNGKLRHPDFYLHFRKVSAISLQPQDGSQEGVLVITGGIPNKHLEFVFLLSKEKRMITINNDLWDRFHDEDQITQWQEKAFPKDKPTENCRRDKGYLCDGEPVFFLIDDFAKTNENPDGLVFFGRAQMFRFPYDLSPVDLIPREIRNADLDLAEVIFGMVNQGKSKKGLAIRGRVFFEDVVANGSKPEWFEEIIVPRILSSPKITCFQHYLTQDGTKGGENLTTYLQGDHTVIRGHKLYWHRWDSEGINAVREFSNHDELRYNKLRDDLQSDSPIDSQHTIIRPVKTGVTFFGRIRFENLTNIELGALLCALQLPEDCAHKLGMGKPLGLGTVQIESKLNLIDRARRYACWENNGILENDGSGFIKRFEEAMLDHAKSSHETIDENKTGLQKIARIEALFYILNWKRRPPELSSTDYIMSLDKFRSRQVLPTPHKVFRENEPAWPSDPPRIAQQEADVSKSNSTGVIATIVAKRLPLPPSQLIKLVEKGQTRRGTLKRDSDRWSVLFEGDLREAMIVNPDKIPEEAAEDRLAEFYIIEQSKKAGIKARFQKLV